MKHSLSHILRLGATRVFLLLALTFGATLTAHAISKAKCIVHVSSVYPGGGVYVSDVTASSPEYGQSSEKETSLGNGWQINLKHEFYLYAQANEGYRFEGWYSDDACTKPASTDVPYHVTITGRTESKNATQTYYAKFVKLKYNSLLSVVCSEGGTAVADKTEVRDSEEAIHTYNLTATPDEGYDFVGWYTDAAYKQAVGTTAEFAYNLNATREDKALSTSFIYAKFEKKSSFPINLFLRHHTDWDGTPMAKEIIDDGQTAHYSFAGWMGTNVAEGLIFNFTTQEGNSQDAVWGPSVSRQTIDEGTPCTDLANTGDDTQCYVYPAVNNFACIDVYISNIPGRTRVEVSKWIPTQEYVYMTTASLDWTRDESKAYRFARTADGIYSGTIDLQPYPAGEETARFFTRPNNGDNDDVFGFATKGELLGDGTHAMALNPAENFTLHRAQTHISIDFHTGQVTLHWVNPFTQATIVFADHEDFEYGKEPVTLYDTKGNPYKTTGSSITGHTAKITGGRLELRNASSWNQGSDRLTVYCDNVFGVVANDVDADGVRIITEATTSKNSWFGPALNSFQIEGINTSNGTFFGDTHVGSLTLYRQARALSEYGTPLEGAEYTTRLSWEELEAENGTYDVTFKCGGKAVFTSSTLQNGQVVALPEYCDSAVITFTNGPLSYEYAEVPVALTACNLRALATAHTQGRTVGFHGRVQVTHIASSETATDVFVCDETDTHFFLQHADGLRDIPVEHFATIRLAGTFNSDIANRINLSGFAASVVGATEEGDYVSQPFEGALGEEQLFRRLRLPQVSVSGGIITYNGNHTVAEGNWTGSLTGLDGIYSLDGIYTDDDAFQVISYSEMIDAPTISNDSRMSDTNWFHHSTLVSISCATNGTIYYLIGEDDETPKAYAEPFTITETSLIKAWVEKGSSASPIATATFQRYAGFVAEEGKHYRIQTQQGYVTMTDDDSYKVLPAAPHRMQAFTFEMLDDSIPNVYRVVGVQGDGSPVELFAQLTISLTDNSALTADGDDLGNACIIEEAPQYTCTLAVHPSAGWGTFIAPYDVEMPLMALAYSCQWNGDILAISRVPGHVLEANKPYLIYSTELIQESYNGYGTATSDACTEGALTGTYVDYATQTGDYVLQAHPNNEGGYNCGFFRVGEVHPTVKASRGYIAAAGSNIQAFLLSDDGETAIEAITASAQNTSGRIYNVAGQRVTAPQRGVYVVEGKKVCY